MSRYEVTIGEVISHTLEVSAGDEREAIERAKWLIANFDDDQLKRERGYAVETVGWDGYEVAEEVVD